MLNTPTPAERVSLLARLKGFSWLHAVLLLLWNCKSITSLLWIPKTIYHVLGIELHMKQKFTECLTKRHRSTAEYFYVVTQSAVESEDPLSGDFER
jgi:hypothetical protein